MKLLIYIEPHPVRNNYFEYYWILEKLAVSITENAKKQHKQWFESIRIVCNPVLGEAIIKKFPALNGMIFFPPPKFQKEIFQYTKYWKTEGIPCWKDLLVGTGEVTNLYCQLLNYVQSEVYEFDTVIVWGNNGAVEKYCRENDVCCVHMELGSTRDPFFPTIVFDSSGVNGSSTIAKVNMEDIAEIVANVHKGSGKNILTNIRDNHEKVGVFDGTYLFDHELEMLVDDRPLALIPLQIADDANLLVYSDYANQLEMLQDIVPLLISNNYKVIVKTHPGVSARLGNVNDQKLCLDYLSVFEEVVVVEELNPKLYCALLSNVDVVITTNSSVGFEAALLGTVVVLLGQALYGAKGAFYSLEQVLQGEVNYEQYKRNIDALANFMALSYCEPSENAFLLRVIYERCSFFQKYRHLAPSELLRKMHETFNQVAFLYDKAYPSCKLESVTSPFHEPFSRREITYIDRDVIVLDHIYGIELGAGIIDGRVDKFIVKEGTVEVGGWALDQRLGKSISMVLIVYNNVIKGVLPVIGIREDVKACFGLSTSLVGFNGVISKPNNFSRVKLEVIGITHDYRANVIAYND